MRNVTKITILTVFVMLCCRAVYADDNLLENGGFETALFGEGNWKCSDIGGWYTEGETEQTTDGAYKGQSVRFDSAIVTQRVKLQRNITYTMEFYIRSDEDCVVNVGFFDGSQDWPLSYPIKTEEIAVNSEWTKKSVEFECKNTQEYLPYINLWDGKGIYIDEVSLKENSSYISRFMTGVDSGGEISYSTDFKGGDAFVTALYDENNKLIDVIPKRKKATFSRVESFGKYTVRAYLMGSDFRVKSQELIYNGQNKDESSIGKLKKITLSEHEIKMNVNGQQALLDAWIEPKLAYNNEIIWGTSDSSVAEVNKNGVVTAKNTGTATVTAKSEDGAISDACMVIVSDYKPTTKLTLDKTNITLQEIDSVCPLHVQNNGDDEVIWNSSDEKVASVTDGVVTAAGKGKATITVSTKNGNVNAKADVTVSVSNKTITNDRFYTDIDGNNIYSQGGGIYRFGDKYYWYGVRYKEADIYASSPHNGKAGNAEYENFTCYSSDDLVNWKLEGDLLDEKPTGWAGRMGVAYNENTKKYVLIAQFAPGMLFAVSDKPTGPFKVDHIFQGELPVKNGFTGDQSIFQDDNGKAYIICSSGNGRAYQYVIPLRESDFLDIDADNIKMLFYDEKGEYIDENGKIAVKDKTGIEGNCMFKYNGSYYFTGSDLYGWNSSRVYVLQSDNILGDYNKDTRLPYIMDNTKNSFAHNSQAGFYTMVHGSENDLVIYCGDRWCDFAGNGIGYNQWVPLSFDENGRPYFNNLHQWKLDAKKGTWEVGDGNNYIANPDFEADRKLVNTLTGWSAFDNVGGYANGNREGKAESGNFVLEQTAPEDYIALISQSLKDLPDGAYTMTAWVKSSGGQNVCSLYVKSGGTKFAKSVKMPIDEWVEVVVSDNIEVKGGECEIGIYSDAHADEWVQADNFRFVKNQ